jgi:hypothetical protein
VDALRSHLHHMWGAVAVGWAQHADFADARGAVVEGIMLVQRPVQAAREIRRVLRPWGRAVLTVWGPRQRNPWLALVFDAVAAKRGGRGRPRLPGRFKMLAGLPPATVRDLRARAREAVRPYQTPSGLELPGVCLIATATRV